MDHFAMGGFIIRDEDVDETSEKLMQLRERHGIVAPFHSSKMRSKKGAWSWLGASGFEQKAANLYEDLNQFLCAMPVSATACVVHRPGYIERYAYYKEERWRLCKSAYAILVERAAKIARRDGRKLAVYVEATGPTEDRQIRNYHRELRNQGSIFNPQNSAKYQPLEQAGFAATMLENPYFFDKKHALGQIADLMLYPLVKGKYEPNYLPYVLLRNAKKIVDDDLAYGSNDLGVKYYCFELDKQKA